ncbi:MAG: protein kinase [Chthoniobacter sp.]|nr:protein kinase [Chthoniobacter sp.]
MPDEPEITPADETAAQPGALPSILGGMSPDELFARGMQSVRMTGGGSLQSWQPPSVAEAARLFPNYEITEMIGRGGMGVVYKGRQTSLDRMVAIKLLPLEVSIDRDFGDRFVREARTMAKMNHPNIVSVFDFGNTTEGHLYFVMEFVEGTTLHHLIKSVGLKPSQSLEIIMRVCEALQYAHSEGVIHRDIKPANILVDTKGRVKVTDFGLARMDTTKTPEEWGQTMTGMVLGTPDYMAPEQKKGVRVDHRADIYSLGVMLYEMLCGEIPAGIFDPPSQRVAVDERIDQVVIRAMQQEPDRRYTSSGEMRTAVEMICNTPLPQKPDGSEAATVPPPPLRPGQVAPPPPPPARSGQQARSEYAAPPKTHAPIGTLITAGCAMVIVGIFAWKELRPAAPVSKEPAATPAPQLAPVTPEPKPEVVKVEPEPPKVDPVVVPPTPVPQIAVVPPPPEPPREPVVPVATPKPDRPIAVVEVPTAIPPRVPPREYITGPARPIPITPITGGGGEPGGAVPPTDEWHTFVASGDSYLRFRRTDDAIEAYASAMEAAQANPKGIAPAEFGRVCMSLSSLQLQNGSQPEARRTLIEGRQFLIRNKGPASAIAQMENLLRKIQKE